MKLKLTDLEQKVAEGIARLGYTGDDAQTIKEVLMYADLRGNNQGIPKISTGGVPRAEDVPEMNIVSQNKCGALVSGGQTMVAAKKAAEMAASLAGQHGVGVVGVNHGSSSSGAIGYFSRTIAEAGYIGIMVVGTGPYVAPTGSAEPKLGTNPISYAFPTSGSPVVFDCATAAMAYFGVVEANIKGEALPEGVAFDKYGQPTTVAAEALEGSVTTFGGHRGYGLSLLVQLLAGPFAGAGYAGARTENGTGTVMIAIDPGLLLDKDEYLASASELCDLVTGAKPVGDRAVQLPGQGGDAKRATAMESNEIEISDAIWNQLCAFVDQ